MARQKGIIKLKGTIGDVTFYKSKDGSLAREKGGVDGERIAKDAAFVRTRENNKEFGTAAGSGKLLRDAIRSMLMRMSDSKLVSRLTQVMTAIKNCDPSGDRGKRTVGAGIITAAGMALLKNFNFNINAPLAAVLFKPFVLNPANGAISIANLEPLNDLAYPPGATHVSIRSAWLNVDFTGLQAEVQLSNIVNLPIVAGSSNVVLTPGAMTSALSTNVYLLSIEYFQEINGVQYPLRNSAFNTLAIVDVQ